MAWGVYTGTVSGQVGSLITALDAILVTGAGWSKEYSGTNKAAYKMASGGVAQHFLRVDDNSTGTGGACEAIVKGARTMSSVDTITADPVPAVAQSALTSNGLIIRKSTSSNSTTRDYVAVADGRTIIMGINTGDDPGTYYVWYGGEFYSYVPSDGYNFMLVARSGENDTTASYEHLTSLVNSNSMSSTQSGGFVMRDYTGTGTSTAIAKHSDNIKMAGANVWTGAATNSVQYPNGADGGFLWLPVSIVEPGTKTLRGHIRGAWATPHYYTSAGIVNENTVSGAGSLSGRTCRVLKQIISSAYAYGAMLLETSDTADTN